MKFEIEKKSLEHLLFPMQSLVEKRNVDSIYLKVLIEKTKSELIVQATDKENSLKGTVKLAGSVGLACVDAKTFFEIVKELPHGKIQIEKPEEKEGLKIKTASSLFNITGAAPENFPVFPEIKKPQFFSLKTNELSSLIHRTSYCISDDETRYHLNGVLCEKTKDILNFAATDGHRLSLAGQKNTEKIELPQSTIIPKKGLNEIDRLLSHEDLEEVELAVQPPRLIVRCGDFLLSVRLIEGKYPNFRKLIVKNPTTKAVIDKNLFIQALRRVSVLSNLQSKNVLFQWKKKSVVLTTKHPDLGDAKEEASLNSFTGGVLDIRFNSGYMLDALNHIQGEKITIEMTTPEAPCVIKTKEQEGVSVIMPMKL